MQTRTPAAIHLATMVAVGSLLWSCMSYVPMWDGFIYARAINDAVRWPPALDSLRLAGHASHFYAALAIAVQALAPDQYWPTLLLGALLIALAAVAFHRLVTLAFPEPTRAVDRALLTACFAVQPSMLAAAVQPGLDLPLVPGFLWCTVLVMERRWVALVLVGTALAFTKETGVLMYAGLLASYGLWTFIRAEGSMRDRMVSVVRLAPLAAPGLIFVAYLVIRARLIPAGEAVVWNAGTAMINQSLVRQLFVPRIDRYLASYLSMIAVLNFAWVVTLFVTAAVLVVVRRTGARRLFGETLRFVATPVGFVGLLVLVTAFLLTRFASYANSRYLLPVMALSLVPLFAALGALRLPVKVQRGVLAALSLMLLMSNVRTVDPVSRALYGTFAFGEHSMLRMTSITHECCASGRDQLVYSLEFTTLERLMSDALGAMRVGDSTLIVLPDSTNWLAVGFVDPMTGRRTLRGVDAIAPGTTESDSASLFSNRYDRAVYLALPNGARDRGLEMLVRDFVVGPERRVSRRGYWLSAYPLTWRAP